MKKTIFSMILLSSSYVMLAQDVKGSNDSNMQNRNGDTSINKNYNRQNSSYNNGNNSSNGSMNNNWNNGGNNSNGTSNYSGNLMNSNNSYNAYGSDIPYNVRQSFSRDYQGNDNVKWQQQNDWWHASYVSGGQSYNRYYNRSGQNFLVALPVYETQVPAEVTNKVNTMYGSSVYDITAVKGYNGQDMYVVRVLDNGQIRTEKLNADGSAYSDNAATINGNNTMPASADTTINGSTNNGSSNTDMNTSNSTSTNTDMNSGNGTDVKANAGKGKNKWKSKTITSDGKKTIIKTKNGKTTTTTSTNDQNQ